MDREEFRPEASQVILDLLRPIRTEQIIAYLEKNGWRLWANHFVWGEGWSLRPEIVRPNMWVYTKPDPETTGPDDPPHVVQVPGREGLRDHLNTLQFAIERIAAVEQTTFVTILCRILNVQQLILYPID